MTRKPEDTTVPSRRADAADERPGDARPQDRPSEGPEREGVDWMDYAKPEGGPTRAMVHLGVHDVESQQGRDSDGGAGAGAKRGNEKGNEKE